VLLQKVLFAGLELIGREYANLIGAKPAGSSYRLAELLQRHQHLHGLLVELALADLLQLALAPEVGQSVARFTFETGGQQKAQRPYRSRS